MIKKIKLTQFQIDRFRQLIRATRRTENGYVFPDDESKKSGYIVQSNCISYTDGQGNITMYYA